MVSASWAFAQAPSELTFTSKYDKFQLRRSGGQYLLGDKSVKLGTFDQFLSLFTRDLEGPCSGLGSSDLTVEARYGEKLVKRRFYVKERIVTDGSQCAPVSGEGIYFIPLHKSWFDDSAILSIPLVAPVKIVKEQKTLAAFSQTNDEWRSTAVGEYPNWEFFNSFKDSLREFVISHRVHRAVTTGKPGFVLLSGGKKYEFFKLGNTLWVGTLPNTPWLVGTHRWTNWGDMEASQWRDSNSAALTVAADKSKELEERKAALANFEGQWSPSLRDVLKGILLDETESNDLKYDAVRLMKQKPSLENMGILIKVLKANGDADLMFSISQALRVRNPKGPVLNPDLDESARQKAIAEWREWWNTVQHTRDKF